MSRKNSVHLVEVEMRDDSVVVNRKRREERSAWWIDKGIENERRQVVVGGGEEQRWGRVWVLGDGEVGNVETESWEEEGKEELGVSWINLRKKIRQRDDRIATDIVAILKKWLQLAFSVAKPS